MFKILFVGDIFAKAGRKACLEQIPLLKKKNKIDFVIANAENCTHGRSLNLQHYKQLLKCGIDVFTMGNHTYDHMYAFETLKVADKIVRPLNISSLTKEAKIGCGSKVFTCKKHKICVTNLVSTQCFNRFKVTNPFQVFQNLLDKQKEKYDLHIVDFHAETTSEKKAFLLSFANKVSAIIGTHSHVQTSDAQIYKNTFFITDVGMTGPKESIIGAKPDEIIELFFGKRSRFHMEPASGPYQFNAVLLTFSNDNKPKEIKLITI